MNRISFRVVVVVTLASLVFAAAPSWAQSHPTPETVKLFDTDALGYPGLAAEGVQQAIYTVGWGFPPLTAAGVQQSLDSYKKLLEQGKQALQEAEAAGSEEPAQRYREDIAGLEQHIAELEAALTSAGINPPNPPTPPDDGGNIGEAMNTPEARTKIKAAQQAAADALTKAADGQYADVRAITGLLVESLQAARQLGLAGMNDESGDLEKQAKDTLTVFSAAFADSCKNQSFDPLFVLGLTRQNQLSPNGDAPVDMEKLERCEFRLLATVSGSGGWRHCGIGIGDWSYRDKFGETSNASGTGCNFSGGRGK